MIFGILFPEWPDQKEWNKLPGRAKAQWVLLAGLQFVGITLGGLSLIYA